MIRTALLFENGDIRFEESIKKPPDRVKWHWTDFSQPTEEEVQYLFGLFGHQHGFSIKDWLLKVRRPKIDNYGEYRFFVLHTLSDLKIYPEVLYLFEGENYIVTFHKSPNRVIEEVWEYMKESPRRMEKGLDYLLYSVINSLVNQYHPLFSKFGNELERLESKHFLNLTQPMINRIFKIRRDLFTLRGSLEPLRDVLQGILHPADDKWKTKYRVLFGDIQDDLIRLVEMTEIYRQMGLDLIESHVSLNSQRMNRVIIILTIITTIFMPLSFIAGIYGMNFDYMPELGWKYGYYSVLGLMGAIAGAMILWFKRKGWF
ncbi:magnesium and cobalt transport protein CorA [Desulfocucumis palustris]|uniref:Magnesium transport protein CorA n=1 Tax=Desulfocucumis palustris TaxID=1898651 RepID=A0A2L2XE75_9FIRM|nr:magnesium/cobalt transporter CorA [Desulfocucumis palustris]GBF32131.1 magnesium and cobalt transport protein CorA [Desulfocucumis palustris]